MSAQQPHASSKLLALGRRLKEEFPELQDPEELLEAGLVYALAGTLAQRMQEWMTTRREDPVARGFKLVNAWCAMEDEEVDNLVQTGFFEVLADREDLRARTVELLGERGRCLYAEIVEFLWGASAVRSLGLDPPGTWGV